MRKPIKARRGCRHYSYKRKIFPQRGFAVCALGVDLSSPGPNKSCHYEPEETCVRREEWTDHERDQWEKFVTFRLNGMSQALDEMPPVSVGYRASIKCPHCGGSFSVERIEKSAYAQCSNTECLGPSHYYLGHKRPWPEKTTQPK
ncbi:MAG: hypothetical protein ABJ360_22630 [Roseobacter sp.]